MGKDLVAVLHRLSSLPVECQIDHAAGPQVLRLEIVAQQAHAVPKISFQGIGDGHVGSGKCGTPSLTQRDASKAQCFAAGQGAYGESVLAAGRVWRDD
jgi:hypothetical protein